MSEAPIQTVVVPARGCGEVGFHVRPDGQVLGRAVDQDGTGAKHLLLKLVQLGDFDVTMETRTDQRGYFRFRGVPSGSYRLGVNPDNMDDPSPQVPYAPTFYPGVRDERSARVIRISEFGRVELENAFRLPPVLKPRTIRVRVILGNGQPVRASVSCTPEGHSYWRKDSADARGVISFAAMDQLAYIVDVDIPSYDEFANAGYERSRWIRVPPGSGTTEVQVVLRKMSSIKRK